MSSEEQAFTIGGRLHVLRPSTLRTCVLSLALLSIPVLASADLTGGYVNKDSSTLMYLRITQVGRQVSGFMQTIRADYRTATGTNAQTAEFIGEADGGSFTIHGDTMNRLFGGSIVRCAGTKTSNGVRLSFPNASGYVGMSTFARCSEGEWNKTLSRFNQDRLIDSTYLWFLQGMASHFKDLADQIQSLRSEVSKRDAKLAEIAKQIPIRQDEIQQCADAVKEATQALEEAKQRYESSQQARRIAEQEASDNDSSAIQQKVRDAERAEREAERNQDRADTVLDRAKDKLDRSKDKMESLLQDRTEVAEGSDERKQRLASIEAEQRLLFSAGKSSSVKVLKQKRLPVAAVKSGVTIYAGPSVKAQSLGNVSGSGRFPVLQAGLGWSLIMLSDRRMAWVPTKSLGPVATLTVTLPKK